MSNVKIRKGAAWVDICDLDFRIRVGSFWKKVKVGDSIFVNGVWKKITCALAFKWIVDPDSSYCEAGVSPYYFKSAYVNVSYPVTMTTAYTAGRPCAFSNPFYGSLDNHIPETDNTQNTTNLNLFGSSNRMFVVPETGNYRLKARILGAIVCNNNSGDSLQTQTIRFVLSRTGSPDIDLIPLGQNSTIGSVNAADFCAPGQYVIQKGQTVPVDITFNQVLNMAAGDIATYRLVINLETHNNQQDGAGESNTTNFNLTVQDLEIQKI